jgi:hypothetical protein
MLKRVVAGIDRFKCYNPYSTRIKKGKVTPKQAYGALRGPRG